MMYDELIKRLRSIADKKREFNIELILEDIAADAIEDLSKTLDEEVEINTALECNMPVWIPVTDRLPEKDGKYLCTVKSFSHYNSKQYRFVDILVFQDGCFFECGIGTQRVTHWMPLPKPPKEESNGV